MPPVTLHIAGVNRLFVILALASVLVIKPQAMLSGKQEGLFLVIEFKQRQKRGLARSRWRRDHQRHRTHIAGRPLSEFAGCSIRCRFYVQHRTHHEFRSG